MMLQSKGMARAKRAAGASARIANQRNQLVCKAQQSDREQVRTVDGIHDMLREVQSRAQSRPMLPPFS